MIETSPHPKGTPDSQNGSNITTMTVFVTFLVGGPYMDHLWIFVLEARECSQTTGNGLKPHNM